MAACLMALLFSVVAAAEKPPNVLMIAVDDLNDWIGCLNAHPGAKTPHIDQLAGNGVLFTRAYCAAPACNPSRVSVMTGLHPTSSGVYVNGQDWREDPDVFGVETLPAMFKRSGYEVLGGGKLYHAASLSPKGYTGYLDDRPWDDFFPSKTKQLPPEVKPEGWPVSGSPYYKGHFDWASLDIEDDEMGDGQTVVWAEGQLAREHEQPLFLAVGLYRPHIPWWTPQKYFDLHPLDQITLPPIAANDLDDVPEAGQNMSRRDWQQWMVENDQWKRAVQGYLASMSFTDAMVGRLMAALADGPMAENTVVVLWSDHGYHLGHKEHWEKFAVWEQATHVPMIVWDKRKGVVGARCEQPVSLLDVYPTLAALCDVEAPEHLDGESLVPLLENPARETGRAVLTTHGFKNHAIRAQRWRYIQYADGTEELYDHEKDPNEFNNLAIGPEHDPVKVRMRMHLPEKNAASKLKSSKRRGKK